MKFCWDSRVEILLWLRSKLNSSVRFTVHSKHAKISPTLINNRDSNKSNSTKSLKLSKKEATEAIEGLAINSLRIAKNDTSTKNYKGIENDSKDLNFINDIVNRTANFDADEAYSILLKSWKLISPYLKFIKRNLLIKMCKLISTP